jgi:hypothetical protein
MKNFKYTPDQEAWLRDLETTRAKQGANRLLNTSGWCCLGRACKLAGIIPKKVGMKDDTGVYTPINKGDENVFLFDECRTGLPISVFRNLHLRGDMGLIEGAENYPELGGHTTLADLNDILGWTFKQIARWIRKNPSAVFTSGYEEG